MAFDTRKSLLAKVRDGNEISWNEFYLTYKPLILLCGGDCGLFQDEKEELVQKVMCEIFSKNIVGKYDPDNIPDNISFKYNPQQGRFRHYLRKIIRNQAIRIFKKRKNHVSMDDEGFAVNMLHAEDKFDNAWNEEWHRHLLNIAMVELRNTVQPNTYCAFEMYAVQNRPIKEVADFLNLSISSVYTAKSRCLAALKDIIKKLEEN